MSKHLTIRDVPEELAEALDAERQRRGTSLDRTVRDLLGQALGMRLVAFDNGLARHAGTWSEDELRQFEAATELLEHVDEELRR